MPNQPQQPIQPVFQTLASIPIQQSGPSTPTTPPQTVAQTSVQPTTPIPRVFTASIISSPQTLLQIPQVSIPQSRPTIQTTVQMPVGQPGTSTIITSQPQFTYQPYQGPYQYRLVPKIHLTRNNCILGIHIRHLFNPSMVQLFLVIHEVFQFPMHRLFLDILVILLLGLV